MNLNIVTVHRVLKTLNTSGGEEAGAESAMTKQHEYLHGRAVAWKRKGANAVQV